jgi:diguanylate cyclase (GGDEF)-like protein
MPTSMSLTKYRLLGSVSAILVAGFLATSVAAYMVSRDTIENGIAEQALPLTGDNIYSEIQKDILRPVFISSLMAHDTFVRDWILAGEKDPEQLVRYLRTVKEKYGTISSFLISNASSKYYHAGGTLKSVREGEPRDAWFYRVRDMKAEYETNVDPDQANRDSMTIFINHRVLDYRGNFIGATGVGLTLDTMGHIIDRYQDRFKRNIYFLDSKGGIVLAGKAMRGQTGSIRARQGVGSIADAILNGSSVPSRLSYHSDKSDVLVNSRFIPELGWYLVVEQNVNDEIGPVRKVFGLNLAISFGVTLLVLLITLAMINRFQRRLEKVATTDALTGLLNRQALELLFRQLILSSQRNGKPFSAILFDIDNFKQINDSHGHLAGDALLRHVADTAKAVVRQSDIVTRWGGDEYLILLGDCDRMQAITLAEQLRQRIERHPLEVELGVKVGANISAGVAQYEDGESDTGFFTRADAALYKSKTAGRNRITAA